MTRNHDTTGRRLLILCLLVLAGWPPLAQGQNQQASVSATLGTNHRSVYEHQKFLLTLAVRSQNVRLGSSFNLTRLPDSSIIRIGPFKELSSQTSRQDGAEITIRRFQCEAEALRPGQFTIAPLLDAEIMVRERFLFGSHWVGSPQRIPLQPLTLTITPLPTANRPDNFSGAVGTFDFAVSLTPQEVAVGDLVTVRMTISGDGYTDTVTCPTIPPIRHFKLYSPNKLSATPDNEIGFEQVLIPQSTEATTLPAITFNFFNTASGTYESVTRGPFSLTFTERQEAASYTPYRPATSDRASPTAGASAPVKKPTTSRWDNGQTIRTVSLLLIFVAVPLLLLGGLLWIRQQSRRPRRLTVPDKKPMGVPMFVFAFGLLAVGIWLGQLEPGNQHSATLTHDITVRLGPANMALPQFELSAGSPVVVLESWDRWVKIDAEGRSGWIPHEALTAGIDQP